MGWKIVLYACLIILFLGVVSGVIYKIIQTTESYAQKAEQITNIEIYNPEDTFFLGIKFWGLKFGLSKPTIKKMADVVKEVKPIPSLNK